MWGPAGKLGGPDPYTLPTHKHAARPGRVRPRVSPSVANLSVPSRWPGQGPLPSAPSEHGPARAAPRRGGAGGRRPLPGGGPGAGRGAGGAGGGAAGGAGVSLPPSLSPVKSRGAAGLSPVSSSCSLGRAAVTVHRRRRGLHRRVRPPASMATTATCTRFTDDYQLFEELGKYGRPPPARPPTLPPPPGRYAAPRPAPQPCTGRCGAPSARPTPSLSRQPPPGPPRPQRPVPQPPPRPAAAARTAASRTAAGTAAPGPLLGALQPRPSRTLQTPLIPSPAAPRPLPTLRRCSHSTLSPVPRPTRLALRTLPALQLQPRCGAPVWGGCLVPGPAPRWCRFQDPCPAAGLCCSTPVPSPHPCSGPGSRARRRRRRIPLPSALSWPLQQPRPPHPHPQRGAGHCSPRPARPPRRFQSWRVRAPFGRRRVEGNIMGKGKASY